MNGYPGAELAVRPQPSPVGLEISGVDLSEEIDTETFEKIESLFNENGVIFFRDQNLSEEDHIRFSRRFGELDSIVLKQYLHPRYPEIFVVSNVIENGRSIGSNDAGQFWHTDSSHFQTPARGSLLYAREVPVQDGQVRGDTVFASMYAAYEGLSGSMKKRLSGLRALHRYGDRYAKRLEVIKARGGTHQELSGEERQAPQAIHPVVRPHPITGRPCLYVNEGLTVRILDVTQAESDALLAELFAHCIQPQYIYRHHWRVGDLLMWDNCSTQHCAVADYALPLRRLMHRTTVKAAPDSNQRKQA